MNPSKRVRFSSSLSKPDHADDHDYFEDDELAIAHEEEDTLPHANVIPAELADPNPPMHILRKSSLKKQPTGSGAAAAASMAGEDSAGVQFELKGTADFRDRMAKAFGAIDTVSHGSSQYPEAPGASLACSYSF